MDVMYIEAGLTLIAVFLLTVVLARFIIPILKSHKAGVRILEIGPRWHKSKEGTPIMGGICFILAILISVKSAQRTNFFLGQAISQRQFAQ